SVEIVPWAVMTNFSLEWFESAPAYTPVARSTYLVLMPSFLPHSPARSATAIVRTEVGVTDFPSPEATGAGFAPASGLACRTQILSRFHPFSGLLRTSAGISPYHGPLSFITVMLGPSSQPRRTYFCSFFILMMRMPALDNVTTPVDFSAIFLPF